MINFQQGSSLADFQEELFRKACSGALFSNSEIAKLKGNMWVKAAAKLAPSNLVIRHLVLLDIVSGMTHNQNSIAKQITLLSGNQIGLRVWAEGYSYWEYTKKFISLYCRTFDVVPLIKQCVKLIDRGFIESAYTRDGVLYPAPFGDLRNEPLAPSLQRKAEVMDNFSSRLLVKYQFAIRAVSSVYGVKPYPLGLNTHCQKDGFNVFIINGKPYMDEDSKIPFKFYEGYANKYDGIVSEAKDTLDAKRLKSTLSIRYY